jgi:hypothetical protein
VATYEYGGQVFTTKGKLAAHIRQAIDYSHRVIGRRFHDDVLSDLFCQHSARFPGVRPEAFAFVYNAPESGRMTGDSLAAEIPGVGFQRFSYKTLLRMREPVLSERLPKLCRERWSQVWRPQLWRGGLCDEPGCSSPARDLDHAGIQHREIVAQCLELIDDALEQQWLDFKSCQGPDQIHYRLPEGHPLTVRYDELTAAGSYLHLCKQCHRGQTSLRCES